MPDDPVIRELRDEISANDHAIVAALNRRIDLVGRLRQHKEEQGIAFVDPERERRMHEDLAASNTGPLSTEGLREIFQAILDLTKREVRRQ
jgi:chorismate mutase